MNLQQQNNMQRTTLTKGQSNIRFVNSQTRMKWVKLALCSITESLLIQIDCTRSNQEQVGICQGTLHFHKRCLGNLGSTCWLERRSTSHHLQEGTQACLQQLPWDFASLPTRKSVCSHTAQEIINPNGVLPSRGRMWIPCKLSNYWHDLLLATNTREMHWTEYAPILDICQLHKSLCHLTGKHKETSYKD